MTFLYLITYLFLFLNYLFLKLIKNIPLLINLFISFFNLFISLIDLIATRLNSKLQKHVSWKPDPGSLSIDAFSISWNYCYSYCFPPFGWIWKVINKIRRKCRLALLITPLLPTQGWFPAILRQAIATPQEFSSMYPQLRGTTKMHPLAPKLQLVALLLLNNTCKIKSYHKRQKTYSSPPDAIHQNIVMLQHTENGSNFVFQGILFHFNQL